MIKEILTGIICLVILFSMQTTYAQEELSLPEGKNIKEWESISAALIMEKRFDEAIIFLDKILEIEPENLKALSNKAGVLIQLEKFSDSLDISNKILEIEPNRISTLGNKAIALKMLKEYEKSFLTFSKMLIMEPENELIKNSRAKLLSGTPTIPTIGSIYEVHGLITIRDQNGNLIGTTESTNARYLQSIFTEKWWEQLEEKKAIMNSKEGQIFTKTNSLIPDDDYIGMLTLQRQMSGYNINIFELYIPMIQVEDTDTAIVQWTIIKK
jgi:tetratricopeptide (TPR) repeat protein